MYLAHYLQLFQRLTTYGSRQSQGRRRATDSDQSWRRWLAAYVTLEHLGALSLEAQILQLDIDFWSLAELRC
jgi:hypothetical protein